MTRNETDADGQSTDSSNVDRRRFLEATGAGAAITALAGCLPDGDDDGGTPTPGDDDTPTPGDTDGTTTTPEEDDESTPEEDDSVTAPEGNLVVGVLGPLSGDVGFVGRGAARSARIAAEEINAAGGVLDGEIEIIEADTGANPGQAQSEVEQLIQQEEVDLLVGTYVSEVTQAILNYIAEFNVPFIVTGSASPTIVEDFIGRDYERFKNFFRTGPVNSYVQAEGMADYADHLADHHGWTDYAFAADNAAWTLPFSETLPGMLADRGYNVKYDERLSIEIDNFRPVMGDLQSLDIDAVFRFFAHISAGEMLGLWHELDYDFGMEGIHVTSMLPEFYDLSGGVATYETTGQGAAGGVAPITDVTQPFTEKYASEYMGEEPPGAHPMYMGFNTYDAIRWYATALEDAGTWDYESHLDEIVDAALGTQIEGTGGPIEVFGPDAEYPHDAVASRDQNGRIEYPVTQWQPEGELECVYPQSFNTADHMAPHWM